MRTGPLTSVIIPCYNGGCYVASAVESVLQQSYPHVEVVVVDDGSTDDSASILSGFGGAIRYVHQANCGLSAARDRGIKEARGDLIAFLDADDLWLPTKLAAQVQRLQERPEVGLVHTEALLLLEETNERNQRPEGATAYDGECYLRFFHRNRVCVSSVVVRRECLEKMGPAPFDENVTKPSVQDYDLWFRIARHYPLAYLDDALTLYRHHEANASKNRRMMAEGEAFVVEKALRSDPELAGRIGSDQVARRLYSLYFEIGYLAWESDDFAGARQWLGRALRQDPTQRKVRALCLATLLPASLIRFLRGMKRHVCDGRA